ncbi:MAG: FAD-dependent oxidoreductase [Chthoniobacteraceae bacterium]
MRIVFVVIAAVFTPFARAESPRAKAMAATVAVSPLAAKTAPTIASKENHGPVQLAKDAAPGAVNGKHYDLIVVGGTAGGVVCAVRAAREGCSVLLVQHNRHLGGMLANGLMQWDALYGGPRAPLFTELLANIEKHYVATFGENSHDHQTMRFTHEHYPVGWVEPHVMERECNRLVAGERNITLLLSHYPGAVERDGAMLKSVTLREYGTTRDVQATATMFADATYEGDLFALAKVPYRVGREARDEFNEPHAGKIFCNVGGGAAPRDAVDGRLNIRAYGQSQGEIDPTSPFTADGAVQAFNYRFCVSKDPANRVLPARPANYNRDEYVNYNRKGIATNAGPNLKSHMNSPILPGENYAYPDASWPEREKIIARHRDFALGLIWFLQNDESVSEAKRAGFREWGLAKDEFTDNEHIPYEMYVREARRIVGRHVFTEHDNSLAPGLARTPIMPDSVAVTDWYMDSHACTTESRPGFHYDGKLILTEESRPAQIPYRALLPQGVDNLLVPVCLSATHVAWGAVRLEPVWMQTGEAAGLAAALARKNGTTPAQIDVRALVRELCRRRHLVSFFNDVKVDEAAEWIPAAEYFGTLGLFAGYDVRAAEPLKRETARVWVEAHAGKRDPLVTARQVATAERSAPGISNSEFARLIGATPAAAGDATITRGEALSALWATVNANTK